MYFPEDQFHPNNVEDDYYSHGAMDDNETYYSYSNESYSVVSNTNRKKQKKSFDSYKSLDKGYHKLKREYNGKKIAVEIYATGYTPGTTIRDAVTGARYPGIVVGSKDEDQFFKVKIVDTGIGREPGNLFYFTPDEFERHYKTTVNPVVKERWEERFHAYQKKYGRNKE